MADKQTKKRVYAREQVQVDERQQRVSPTAHMVDAKGAQGQAIVGHNRNYSQASLLAGISNIFGTLMEQNKLRYLEQKEEQTYQRRKAEKEAEERINGLERIAAIGEGLKLNDIIEEKTRTGEWGEDEVMQYVDERMNGDYQGANAFRSAAMPYVEKALQTARNNVTGRTKQDELDSYLAVTRQGFSALHDSFDPDDMDAYNSQRTALYAGHKEAGLSGKDLDTLEMESLSSQIRKYAVTEPVKAQALIELAERERPDGTPSLIASIPGGFAMLEELRENSVNKALSESKREQAEAEKTLRESTKDNYIVTLTEMGALEGREALDEWELNNWSALTVEEKTAKYGDYAPNVGDALERAKNNAQKPADNDKALAFWTMAIARGEADFDDLNEDQRLDDVQRAKFFAQMKANEQNEQKGFIPDRSHAATLLSGIEKNWKGSVYGTPYTASSVLEPGKPPLVSPEGICYQTELFKRFNALDPITDPQEANRRKREIAQELESDILSGRFKYEDKAGVIKDTFPQLKITEKIKQGIPFSESDITALGEAYFVGGTKQLTDDYGLDFLQLPTADRNSILGIVQKRKTELEALRAQSFWGNVDGIDAGTELERQQLEEAHRLTMEAMALEKRLWDGEEITTDG